MGKSTIPLVSSVLQAKNNFVYETDVSLQIIKIASDFLGQPVPEQLEKNYYKLKCEELLYYIMAILMRREAIPTSSMHIDDIKALYTL